MHYYQNTRRIGKPFIYKNIIMFEKEAGRDDEMVSCIHAQGKGQFGIGMCIACYRLITTEQKEIARAMKKAGWTKSLVERVEG